MKRLTKQALRDFALSHDLDLFGVANIERFANAPADMHPSAIYPEARSVIVVGRRILRGGWRGIEEGTHWPSYTHFNYHGLLNSYFLQLGVYETACFIEDHGHEAVPYYPGVPEAKTPLPPLRPGTPSRDVQLSIRVAGVAAGVGEIGWSKVFLTRRFGPRQRLAAIITDLELEGDPLVEPLSICRMDMACAKGCPGAIPHVREGRSIQLRIEDKTYRWADVDMGRCTLAHCGLDPKTSPFIHKSLPGFHFDITRQRVSEEVAFRFAWPTSTGTWWRPTVDFPEPEIIPGHCYLSLWGQAGAFAVEASRGCMRACFDFLEGHGHTENTFHGGRFIRRPRWELSCTCGECSSPCGKQQQEGKPPARGKAAGGGRTKKSK